MHRTLVVYCSRTGRTRAVAQTIATALDADIEELAEAHSRRGLFGWLRSLREAVQKKPADIRAPQRDPAHYDLVVLGSPVWASTISSPMRAYLAAHGTQAKHIALFCTLGGSGGDKMLNEMAKLCGRRPVATLAVMEAERLSGTHQAKIVAFVEALSSPAPEAVKAA